MNSDFPTRLTAQLRANPLYFEEMDRILLSELVCHYYEGKLDADDASEVESLLKTDPSAKEICERLQAADRFAASPEGKDWLKNLPDRVLPPRKVDASSTLAPTFFDALSAWLAGLFSSLSLQAEYSDPTAGSTVHKFTAPAGSPYRAQIERDAAGQWRFFIFTSSAEAAKLKIPLKIEEEAPVLSFVAGEPGHFMAEVLITEEMAKALQSGSRPVFPPAE